MNVRERNCKSIYVQPKPRSLSLSSSVCRSPSCLSRRRQNWRSPAGIRTQLLTCEQWRLNHFSSSKSVYKADESLTVRSGLRGRKETDTQQLRGVKSCYDATALQEFLSIMNWNIIVLRYFQQWRFTSSRECLVLCLSRHSEERDEAIFFGDIPAIADILILNLKDGSSGERCYTCSRGTLALQGDWICKSTPPVFELRARGRTQSDGRVKNGSEGYSPRETCFVADIHQLSPLVAALSYVDLIDFRSYLWEKRWFFEFHFQRVKERCSAFPISSKNWQPTRLTIPERLF